MIQITRKAAFPIPDILTQKGIELALQMITAYDAG